jgi:6-phosphogluconolactonase/glucosamine-6-phosphate isomerase/deaminase
MAKNLQIVKSLAEPIGTLWKELQEKYTAKGNFYVAAPLSSTPLPIYRWLVKHAKQIKNWDRIRFVLMDELVINKGKYLASNNPASYEKFAKQNLINPLENKVGLSRKVLIKPPIKKLNTFKVPLNLLILALGVSGNYANVMPGTSFKKGWHIEKLSPDFIKAHTKKSSKSYAGTKFTKFGMSLGPQQLLKADNIVVIVSGKQKREVTKKLLSYSKFDSQFPLSLIYHSKIKNKVRIYITNDVLG